MKPLPTIFIQVSDLDEIIFAHRNKAYGAYELRKHYNGRLLKAFMITASTTLVFFFLLTWSFNHRKPESNVPFIIIPDSISHVFMDPVEVHTQKQTAEQVYSEEIPTEVVTDSNLVEPKQDSSVAALPPGTGSALKGDTTSQSGVAASKGIVSDTGSGKGSGHTEVFSMAPDVYPSFPGGNKAFSRYVQKHFTCSSENISRGETEGKIILRFFVMKDGSITNVEVLKDNVGIDCVDEAKNMLRNSPKWNPGLQNNQPINVVLVLPITILRE